MDAPPLLAALSTACVPLAWAGADGRLAWCNPAFAALFQPPAQAGDELPGRLGPERWARLTDPAGDAAALALAPPGGGCRLQAQPAGDGSWVLIGHEPAGADDQAADAHDEASLHELAAQAEMLRGELDAALSLARIGVWRHELDSGCIHLDERCAAIIGAPLTSEGITLEQARALMHPDDRAIAARSAAHTRERGEPSDMELRYPQPDGSVRHVMSRRVLQCDASGRPVRHVGVMIDITETLEQRRLAVENARRLEAAAGAARIGLWSSDSNRISANWNRLVFELLGLPADEAPPSLAEWVQRCVHPLDREHVMERSRHWWRTADTDHEITFRVIRPCDGALRWLVLRGRTHQAGAGGVRRSEGVLIDITEQQQTLQRLTDTIERATLTAQAIGLGSWESDATNLVIHWDAQMFRLRGVDSPGRLIEPAEIASYLHPDEREAVMAAQVERIRQGGPWQSEFRVQWPDGTVRWITSHSVPVLDAQGRPLRRIGLNWDTTESHLAAQALRERERAVAENQAKSRWMSRISHELRTPLNAVLGFTQLARAHADPADAARRDGWLGLVEDASRHLLALIDDVLELTGAAAGELRLALQPVALAEVVHGAVQLVSAEAQARGIALHIETPTGQAMADPLRLRQVLLNLLNNAIKYNRPGGQVRVSVRPAAGRLEIEVADTGVGIAPARLPQAFEAFNRLGAEGGSIPGTGVGLAIVKLLVEQMGGEVTVRSERDHGSVFTVRLPEAPPDAVAPAAATAPLQAREPDPPALAAPRAPSSPGRSPARVLYIEDNPVNALLVRELLAGRPDVELILADDGASGLAAAWSRLPELILIDMLLPDMHGRGVLQALRGDPRTAAITCVALSANATDEDMHEARLAGFADYWTKPIDVGRFLGQLSAALGRPV